jgi:hypothetical protein
MMFVVGVGVEKKPSQTCLPVRCCSAEEGQVLQQRCLLLLMMLLLLVAMPNLRAKS